MAKAWKEWLWVRESLLPEIQSMHTAKLGRVESNGRLRAFLSYVKHHFVHFIEKGSGTFNIDGHNFQAAAGSFIFFFPGQTARYSDTLQTPWKMIWLQICGSEISPILRHFGITPANPLIKVDDSDIVVVSEKLHELISQFEHSPCDPLLPSIAPWELVAAVRQYAFPEPLSVHSMPLIEKARLLLKDPVQHIPNVEELASQLGVSRITLFRIFRDQLNISPKEYIDQSRHRRASNLLEQSSLRIKDIAAFCGFLTQHHFSAWFRQRSGQSPTEYRQRYQAEQQTPT